MQRRLGIGRAVAQQVENTPVLEGGRAATKLFDGCPAKGVQEDLQRGVGADFMQRLALVLKDLLASHVLGVQHAAFGRTVHVLDQVAGQGAGQKGVLLLDKGSGRRVGQVLDGLTTQDRQFAPA